MSLGSGNCICGKKGTKVCNKCRLAKYCSRECQVADFPKHKTICCHLSASTDTAAIAQACETLKLLPTYYTVKPWPMSTKACTRVPLEQLLPQFLCLAVTHHQCVVVQHYSPLVSATRKGNQLRIVSLKADRRTQGFQAFTSFKSFNQYAPQPGAPASALEDLRAAYLMLSFAAKCNQVVCCFGWLVLSMLQTHILTYGGKRVVGWAIQDGTLNSNHKDITDLCPTEVVSRAHLPEVLQCLDSGRPIPPHMGTQLGSVGRNNVHVWLTFFTEDGGAFDLDLSAFQFGNASLPVPCVVPVSHTVTTAFNGMVTRSRVLGNDMPSFVDTVFALIEAHVRSVNSMTASRHRIEDMFLKFAHTAQQLLSPGAQADLRRFARPDTFWDMLMDPRLQDINT
jgi:hypothetical protein